MEPEIANVLQAACYSAAAFGGIYAIARYSFLKRKSDNETHAERTRADMESSKLEADLQRQKVELIASPQYQEYQKRRIEAMRGFVESHQEWLTWDCEVVEDTLDSIVGPNPLA